MYRREFLRASAVLALSAAPGSGVRARASAGTLVFHHPACGKHFTGADHPEHATRVDAVLNAMRVLERQGLIAVKRGVPASETQVALVHSPAYIQLVKHEVQAGRAQLSTGDANISAGSFEAALAAVGCVLSGVDAVMTGAAGNAFCAVRPPGHHASAERGMGFCLFNNVAIAARHAQRQHGVERILIADWDVHHGNGTQDIFWTDGSVLFFDTHMDPGYPGTGAAEEVGEGKARGRIINRPYPHGAGREHIVRAYGEELMPAADAFKPELVLISAGFDSRVDDPLGQFRLTDRDYADMTAVLMDIARKHARGRIVSALEGGYNLNGLASATTAHVKVLAGEPPAT